jgi:ATP adenylyltransferase
VSLDVLWAGWRMPYIRKAGKEGTAAKGCLFCATARARPGKRNLLLAKTPRVLAMLNRYPYSVGHVMVATRRHTPSLSGLTEEESVDLTEWLGRMELAIQRAYRPHGFNIGLNLGRVAGAGVLGHLHWHVVPRWNGDTNFMPTTAGAKVIPEALDRTYERLAKELAALSARRGARRRT